MRSAFRGSRNLAPCCLLVLAATAAVLPAHGASVQIDLDGDPSNGAESTVETKVLQSFPVMIENVVTNHTVGLSFSFNWAGAGPGGFNSILYPGPDVGTKWEWSTVSQVYSISTDGSFYENASGVPSFGTPPGGFVSPGGSARTFTLPGKSIFPNQVTTSTASLTASLITFFSPEPPPVATCESTFVPGVYTQTITNNSGEPLTLVVEEEDCCLEPQQIICEDGCKSYLVDDANCGDCGVTCAFDEFCDGGECAPICPGDLVLCGQTCVDLLADPANCGACGILCGSNQICLEATCTFCEPNETVCGNECVAILEDPNNCGGCGVTCGSEEYCNDGSCAPICPGDLVLCGQTCVDLLADPANCGACGILCGSNQICVEATCTFCEPNETVCGNECVTILDDPQNCGGCGAVCDFSDCPTGTGTCFQGACICDPVDPASDSGAPVIVVDPIRNGPPESAVRVPARGREQRPRKPPAVQRGRAAVTSLPVTQPRSLLEPERETRLTGRTATYAKPPATSRREAEQESAVVVTRPVARSQSRSLPQWGPTVVRTHPLTRPQSLLLPQSGPRSPVVRPQSSSAPPRPERVQQAGNAGRSVAEPKPGTTRSTSGMAERYLARGKIRRAAAGEDSKWLAPGVGRATTASPTVEEAPICEFQEPIEEVIPDGETFTQCQVGAVVGTEVFTRATVVADGELVGEGPCAVFVPNEEVVVDDFYGTIDSVVLQDTSGDGLLQPGEQGDLLISLVNVGPLELMNAVATLSGPPDAFNPYEVTVITDTAFFPDFPAFEAIGDCDTPPVLDPKTALSPFTVVIPVDQEPNVGRALILDIEGDNVGPVTFQTQVIIGIGERCDPADFNGEAYDGLEGFLEPLDVQLVPRGMEVNYSDTPYNRGDLVPLRLRLKCGELTLPGQDIDPKPRIISIVHDTLGSLSLELINVGVGPFPVSPFFFCGAEECGFRVNTTHLPAGTYVLGIQMPDSRVFEAGFTLLDYENPGGE